jgi:hypothetical protein
MYCRDCYQRAEVGYIRLFGCDRWCWRFLLYLYHFDVSSMLVCMISAMTPFVRLVTYQTQSDLGQRKADVEARV